MHWSRSFTFGVWAGCGATVAGHWLADRLAGRAERRRFETRALEWKLRRSRGPRLREGL